MKDSYTIEFKGKKIVLNETNIKEIYFFTKCNKVPFYNEIRDYLNSNFNNKIILEWNDEFVNKYLNEIEILLELDGLEIIRKICINFKRVLNVFLTVRNTYSRIINLLTRMYKKFGYFMSYSFIDSNPDFNVFGGVLNVSYVYRLSSKEKEFYENCHAYSIFYVDNIDYIGLLPQLYYLNYLDLFWECIDEIIIPIYEHFNEPSKYLKDNNLIYDDTQTINDFGLKLELDKFVKENNIKR